MQGGFSVLIIIREEQETGVSGFKVSAADRDKLQLVKEHAEKGKFDILLVFMFDRLGRKSDETPFVVEWFVKKGIKVWSVNEGEQRFDSHTDRLTITSVSGRLTVKAKKPP
ncbi:recombinase family protein [Lacrimispora sp. 38-1]|uniref:recombinase family protein n=1 Tax=Lacrimispora sp. 38-1 TaxID=3125778 RepID=UPI003CF3AEAC